MTEPTIEAIVARGLAELDSRGWERCVIVGDEVGAAQAARIAGQRPGAVRALVMGHPALDFNAARQAAMRSTRRSAMRWCSSAAPTTAATSGH